MGLIAIISAVLCDASHLNSTEFGWSVVITLGIMTALAVMHDLQGRP